MASAVRHDRGFGEKLVRDYATSGETHVAFARQRGVSVGALRHWLYKLRREDTSRVAAPIRMLPITITPSPTPERLEIDVEGLVLRFRAGTDVGYVAQVVTALRAHA